MANMEMVNMNVNLVSAGGISSLGAANSGNAHAVLSNPQMQAMDKMSAAMTAPGGNNFASLAEKLEGVKLDINPQFEQGMKNLGLANNYLAECENPMPNFQDKPLSGMPFELPKEPLAMPNAKAMPGMDKAMPAQAPNPIEQGLAGCFGDKINPGERQAIADFYGKPGNNAAPQPQFGMPGQVGMPQPQAGKPGPAGMPQPQVPGFPQPQAAAPQNAQFAAQFPGQQAPAVMPQPKAPQAPAAAHPVKNVPQPPANAVKTPPVNAEPNIRPEAAMPEDFMQAMRPENMRFDFDGMPGNNFAFNEAQHGSSVLAQYMQNTEAALAQGNNFVNGMLAEQPYAGNMNMPMGSAAVNGAGMEGAAGMNGVNPLAAGDAGPKQFVNPIDMVGSTAMSTNMANLEQLVNMDLMNKFASGFSMQ